jgi:hypothetical protein
MQVTIGVGLLVQFMQRPIAEHLLNEPLVLLVAAIAPNDVFWLRRPANIFDPLLDRRSQGRFLLWPHATSVPEAGNIGLGHCFP